MSKNEFKINVNNIDMLLNFLPEKINAALQACGDVAETHAKELCPVGKVDGGSLRNSIESRVEENTRMVIGASANYATYVECGTGAANYPGGTTKESWVYMGEDGNFHIAHPMAARPFIKPALADHVDEYKKILEMMLN